MNKLFILSLFSLCLSLFVSAQTPNPGLLLNEIQRMRLLQVPESNKPQPDNILGGNLSDALDHAFDSVSTLSTIKGFTAAVKLPNGSTWKRASGLAATGKPLTSDYLMGMGSITKTFVATTLLLMAEEGKLSLDDSIGKYVGPYPNIDGHATVRQLLSHRTGFNDYLNENPAATDAVLENLDSIWITDTVLKHFVLKPNFPVNASWSYSNTNYLLAGRIIEKLTAKPWYVEVRKRILEPQGLTHTFAYPWESTGNQPIAHLWMDLFGNGSYVDAQELGLPIEGIFSFAAGAGCLMTTTSDLTLFMERLFGGHILKPATLAEMQADQIMDTSTGALYGLGTTSFLALEPLENWGHDGSIIYNSLCLYFPKYNISIAVQQNDERTSTPQLPVVDVSSMFLSLLSAFLEYTATTPTLEPSDASTPNVFPNPTTDLLNVQLLEQPNALPLMLTDLNGRTVLIQTLSNVDTRISLAHLPAGMYILRIGGYAQKVTIGY